MERKDRNLAPALAIMLSTMMLVGTLVAVERYSRTSMQAIHGVAAELQEREFDAAGQVAALGHDLEKLAARVEGAERVDKLLIGWIDQLAEERSLDMEVLQRSADSLLNHAVRIDALESVLPTPELPPGIVTPLYRELGVPADAEPLEPDESAAGDGGLDAESVYPIPKRLPPPPPPQATPEPDDGEPQNTDRRWQPPTTDVWGDEYYRNL